MSLLEMKNVSFIDNTTQVISDTSLSIEKGSVTALLGESGGGKSTVLKLLAGIVIPTKGNIFYNGKELSKMSKKENLDFRKNSAFMFQNSALWANQNIYQNMELPLKIHFPQMSEEEIDVKIKETLKKIIEFNTKEDLTKNFDEITKQTFSEKRTLLLLMIEMNISLRPAAKEVIPLTI